MRQNHGTVEQSQFQVAASTYIRSISRFAAKADDVVGFAGHSYLVTGMRVLHRTSACSAPFTKSESSLDGRQGDYGSDLLK